jgi:hypothetical protein
LSVAQLATAKCSHATAHTNATMPDPGREAGS